MKINLPPILDWGVRIIGFFFILFLSVEADRLAFRMMNAQNSISFGLGVSLLLGINILTFFLLYEISKSTFYKYLKNN